MDTLCNVNNENMCIGGLVKDEYLRQFSPILHKNICRGYSLEACMSLRRYKKNYNQIFFHYSFAV